MGARYFPNLSRTHFRNKTLEVKNASVAPILLANEITTVPKKTPKSTNDTPKTDPRTTKKKSTDFYIFSNDFNTMLAPVGLTLGAKIA